MKSSNPAQRPAPSAQRPAPSAQRLSRLDLASEKSSFATKLRYIAGRIVPESSALYKFLYFRYVRFFSKHERPNELVLNVMLTDICNLNCRGCATYSPLVKNAEMLDLKQYGQNIKRVGDLVNGEAKSIRLVGGEPLLHAEVAHVMELTRKAFPKGTIGMITNGTLLLKMDESFWKTCHANNIEIEITPYPIKLKIDRIMELAEKFGVKIVCYNKGTLLVTKDTFRKIALNVVPSDGVKNHKLCNYKECQTMRGDRVYRCNPPCFVGSVNSYFGEKFEVKEGDYLVVDNISSKEELFDFLGDEPIPFCRYCDIKKWEFGRPWKISKKDRSEWM